MPKPGPAGRRHGGAALGHATPHLSIDGATVLALRRTLVLSLALSLEGLEGMAQRRSYWAAKSNRIMLNADVDVLKIVFEAWDV